MAKKEKAAKGKKEKGATEKVYIGPIVRETHELHVAGIPGSFLVTNQFNAKARIMMLTDQQCIDVAHMAKDPDFEGYLSGYAIDDDNNMSLSGRWWGLPTMMFKKGAINACSRFPDVAKTEIAQGVHFNGEFVRLEGAPPYVREDAVKIGSWNNKTTDLRYRLCFPSWYTKLQVTIVPSVIDIGSVINLINAAGSFSGAGEYRPERQGEWGQYQVVDEKYIKSVLKLSPAKPRDPSSIKEFAGKFDAWKANLLANVTTVVNKMLGATDEQKAAKLASIKHIISNPYIFNRDAVC